MLAFRFTRTVAFGAFVSLSAISWAGSVDLTTFGHGTEQARYARYTVEMGQLLGDTVDDWAEPEPRYDGAYDYLSHRGQGAQGGYAMNDGILNAWGSTCTTWQSTDAEDFFGYRFKRPATITELNFNNAIFHDGGTFAAEPRVEVLVGGPMESGGTWQQIGVSWDTPYDTTYGSWIYRQYKITPSTPTDQVWGVRLIGATAPCPSSAADPNGDLGIGEFQVSGVSSIAAKVDLSVNLALNQTPIWTHTDFLGNPITQLGRPEILTDGDLSYANYDTTYNETLTASEERIGAMFDTPKANVSAVGITMIFFDIEDAVGMNLYNGGWIAAADIDVKYTTDQGATWQSVTGLDLGRLPDMETELEDIYWSYIHSELLTFDTIETPIDGICLAGPAVVRPSEGDLDPDGFVGTLEFEAFAAASIPQHIPGDATGDGYVDAADAAILAQNWGQYDPESIGWSDGDFDGDFRVGASDAAILAANWNPNPGEGTAVPEPGAIAMLFGLGMVFSARRTRW